MKIISCIALLLVFFVQTTFAQLEKYQVVYKACTSVGSSKSKSSSFNDQVNRSSAITKTKYGKKRLFKFGEFSASALSVSTESKSRQVFKFGGSDIESSYRFSQNNGRLQNQVQVSDRLEVKSVALRKGVQLPVSVQFVQLGTLMVGNAHWEFFLDDENLIDNSKPEIIGYLYGTNREIAIIRHKRTLSFELEGKEVAELHHPVLGNSSIKMEKKLDQETQTALAAVLSSVLIKRILVE
jgi:hypothetical protein